MSHLSKIFSNQKIDVPNRSGFDMSHENMGTLKVGTLTPILCEEVLPNETYSIGSLMQVQLPPMATNFYGRIDCRLEAFFVPNRIIWGGWQAYMTMPQNNPYGSPVVRPETLPQLTLPATTNGIAEVKAGTLADYLGFKMPSDATGTAGSINIMNALPFLAYHKIYDDWYRNTKIQKPVYVNKSTPDSTTPINMPWYSGTKDITLANGNFNDGVSIFSLRQRNYAKDYFTTAALYPQASGAVGGSQVVAPVEGDNSTFTIAQLRQANVLQRWLERNNVAGERYSDQIKATWGIMPADAIVDRSILLGSTSFAVYNKSVMQTNDTANPSDSQNPFGTVGAKYADSLGLGQDSLVQSFTSTEHGHIIILASLVPHANYSTGVRRLFNRSKIGDFANPLLQGLGEQVIGVNELRGQAINSTGNGDTFGYQQQYSEYKYHDDEVHGLLRDGQSLQAFALQRAFKYDTPPILSTDFIQIKETDIDQVSAASLTISEFGAWYDAYISMKKVSPLSEYVIPTLGDMKNTHKEDVPYRGRQL